MKTLRVAVVLLIFTTLGFAKGKKEDLPYFFPVNVISTNDPFKQFQEFLNYLNSSSSCYQQSGGAPFIYQGSSGFQDPDTASTSGPRNGPLTLYFDNVVSRDNDKYLATTFCGQSEITKKQLRAALEYRKKRNHADAEYNYKFYKPISDSAVNLFVDRAVAASGVSERDIRSKLDRSIPGFPNVTHREFYGLPRPIKVSDFIPLDEHLALHPSAPGTLGLTWLGSGRIDLNPQAEVFDYLNGTSKVRAHEMVHVNKILQRFPFSEFYDPEFEAEFPMVFDPRNKIDIIFHPYPKDARELSLIYQGVDIRKVRDQFVDFAGSWEVDRVKYSAAVNEFERTKMMMLDVSPSALSEFYSDWIYWFALNQRLGNPNTVFYVMTAAKYNPTILGGEKKTLEWLAAHDKEIKEMSEGAEVSSSMQKGARLNTMLEKLKNGSSNPFKITDGYDRFIEYGKSENSQTLTGPEDNPTYRTYFLRRAAEKGWSLEEAEAAYGWSYRRFLIERADHTFAPDYNRVTADERIQILETMLEIFRQVLTDQGEWKKYIDAVGIRKDLEHDEEITRAQREILKTRSSDKPSFILLFSPHK